MDVDRILDIIDEVAVGMPFAAPGRIPPEDWTGWGSVLQRLEIPEDEVDQEAVVHARKIALFAENVEQKKIRRATQMAALGVGANIVAEKAVHVEGTGGVLLYRVQWTSADGSTLSAFLSEEVLREAYPNAQAMLYAWQASRGGLLHMRAVEPAAFDPNETTALVLGVSHAAAKEAEATAARSAATAPAAPKAAASAAANGVCHPPERPLSPTLPAAQMQSPSRHAASRFMRSNGVGWNSGRASPAAGRRQQDQQAAELQPHATGRGAGQPGGLAVAGALAGALGREQGGQAAQGAHGQPQQQRRVQQCALPVHDNKLDNEDQEGHPAAILALQRAFHASFKRALREHKRQELLLKLAAQADRLFIQHAALAQEEARAAAARARRRQAAAPAGLAGADPPQQQPHMQPTAPPDGQGAGAVPVAHAKALPGGSPTAARSRLVVGVAPDVVLGATRTARADAPAAHQRQQRGSALPVAAAPPGPWYGRGGQGRTARPLSPELREIEAGPQKRRRLEAPPPAEGRRGRRAVAPATQPQPPGPHAREAGAARQQQQPGLGGGAAAAAAVTVDGGAAVAARQPRAAPRAPGGAARRRPDTHGGGGPPARRASAEGREPLSVVSSTGIRTTASAAAALGKLGEFLAARHSAATAAAAAAQQRRVVQSGGQARAVIANGAGRGGGTGGAAEPAQQPAASPPREEQPAADAHANGGVEQQRRHATRRLPPSLICRGLPRTAAASGNSLASPPGEVAATAPQGRLRSLPKTTLPLVRSYPLGTAASTAAGGAAPAATAAVAGDTAATAAVAPPLQPSPTLGAAVPDTSNGAAPSPHDGTMAPAARAETTATSPAVHAVHAAGQQQPTLASAGGDGTAAGSALLAPVNNGGVEAHATAVGSSGGAGTAAAEAALGAAAPVDAQLDQRNAVLENLFVSQGIQTSQTLLEGWMPNGLQPVTTGVRAVAVQTSQLPDYPTMPPQQQGQQQQGQQHQQGQQRQPTKPPASTADPPGAAAVGAADGIDDNPSRLAAQVAAAGSQHAGDEDQPTGTASGGIALHAAQAWLGASRCVLQTQSGSLHVRNGTVRVTPGWSRVAMAAMHKLPSDSPASAKHAAAGACRGDDEGFAGADASWLPTYPPDGGNYAEELGGLLPEEGNPLRDPTELDRAPRRYRAPGPGSTPVATALRLGEVTELVAEDTGAAAAVAAAAVQVQGAGSAQAAEGDADAVGEGVSLGASERSMQAVGDGGVGPVAGNGNDVAVAGTGHLVGPGDQDAEQQPVQLPVEEAPSHAIGEEVSPHVTGAEAQQPSGDEEDAQSQGMCSQDFGFALHSAPQFFTQPY